MQLARTALLIGIVAMLGGCAWLFPRTADLEKVHQTYRLEFSQAFIPEATDAKPGNSLCGSEATGENRFTETLRSIRNFRMEHGLESAEAAHLTVLEGMIYVQTGHTGMAKLLETQVATAQGKLISSDKGIVTRDALFAEAYSLLIRGWGRICDMKRIEAEKKRLLDTGTQEDREKANKIVDQEFTKEVASKILIPVSFSTASGNIQNILDTHLKNKQLAVPDSDEGAIYLATTASIFDMWTYATVIKRCSEYANTFKNESICDVTPKPNQSREDAIAAKAQPEFFEKARKRIEPFLSAPEKEAAKQVEIGLSNNSSGRWRYLSWYSFLCAATPQVNEHGEKIMGNCIKP